MNKEWTDSFDLFLLWLNPDRDLAAQVYEDLRKRLIVMFNCRGCAVSEDLADETFNRVMRRLPAMIDSYVGKPSSYIFTTAHHVHLDYIDKALEPLPENPPEIPQLENEEDEIVFHCLEKCLDKLSPDDRELILSYYSEKKKAKIDHRKKLALCLGKELNALRIQMYRTRASLQPCIDDCLKAKGSF